MQKLLSDIIAIKNILKNTKLNLFLFFTGWLATRFGGKYMFGGGVLGTALLTIVSPPASRISVYLLVVLRVIEGLLEVRGDILV